MIAATEYPEIPRAPAWVVDGVYRALDVTDTLLGRLEIPYSMVAGTLLGAVRHRAMIPWDRDADLAIRQQDVALLQAEATSFLHPRGFGFCEYESSVMRIFPLDGRRTGYLFRFPYVDVFPMSPIDGTWAYDLPQYRKWWPQAYLESDSFDNLQRCEFGALRLSGVSDEAALAYVKRVYGPGWSKPKPRPYRPAQVAPRLPPILLAPPPAAGPGVGPSQVVDAEVDQVDDGLVIFQRRPERVHYLNNTAALVYVMSTGATSAIEMAIGLEQAFGLTATPLAKTTECIDRLVDLGILELLPELAAERPAAGGPRRSFVRELVAAGFKAPAVRTFSSATARPSRSRSGAPARSTDAVDPAEEVVLVLTGFGVGISVSDTSSLAIADRLAALMPAELLGGVDDGVQLAFVVEPGQRGGVSVGVDDDPRRTFLTASQAVTWLRGQIDEAMARRATEEMFVHAGVVGWRGRAILLPGRSGTGKTSLVAALVDRGAVYYSDDFAPITAEGLVSSYARAPSVRRDPRPTRCIESPVRTQARPPLPISLVVATSFQSGAGWHPAVVRGAAAMLTLLDNVIMAREQPRRALATVKTIASSCVTLSGSRPEAREIAGDLLGRLDKILDGEAPGDDASPATSRAPSRSGRRGDVAQRMRVEGWTAEVVAALADAGVRPILLTGPAVRWLHPDDPSRTDCHADLLVGPEDHAAARELLADRDLTAQAPTQADGHLALSFTRERDGATVDVHTTLQGLLDVPAARVWEAAQRDAGSLIVGGSPVAVLGPAMRLLDVTLRVGADDVPGDRAWTDLTRALEVGTKEEWEAALDLGRELGLSNELAARLRPHDEAAAWLTARPGP